LSETTRGFILQPTYRIEAGLPVIHLWGKLETGETFLVRDDRLVPYFYIQERDAEKARELGVERILPCDRVSLKGEPVVRVELATPPDTPPVRDRLQRFGIPTYEADVRFAMRFLIDHGIRGSLAIAGTHTSGRGVDRVYENPTLAPTDWTPSLKVLSLDIETDPQARRILSAALHGCGASEVLLLTPQGFDCPATATAVRSEAQLLRRLGERICELDPDVLTGWNVIDFDFAVLVKRSEALNVGLNVARGVGPARLRPGRGPREASRMFVPGRLVLDGLQLLRGAFIRMERYSLNFVAQQVLGEGKTLPGHDRAAEILRLFKEDRERFVEYNLTDARLVNEILENLQLVELAVERSRLTGLPPDRVASSVAAFDFLYLSRLGKRSVVAPSVRSDRALDETMGGGHVLEPQPGLYENVLVFDFKSLYPSLIRTFQIDPLGYVESPRPDQDLIIAPNGAAFRREDGILTLLLDELFPRREAAIQKGSEVESYAIKILMNSFFGVLGTPVCRFFNPAVANAITSSGRQILLWSRDRLEAWGHRVLYGDTDSLFVESGAPDHVAAQRLGEELVTGLNEVLGEYLRHEWEVESRLEVELEERYLRLFLPSLRHGTKGARKRYAGLVEREGRPEVVFTGLEAVRRDWTDLARQTQRELYRRLFFDEPVEEYLQQLASDLREGRLDELLVYRKALRKNLDAYTATTPPHVAAARKMSTRPGRLISYVVTTAGPEPLDEQRSPIDYQHYLEKQPRPITEPVLGYLGIDFAKAIGEDRQLELF
jgi:DNA polymerase-2